MRSSVASKIFDEIDALPAAAHGKLLSMLLPALQRHILALAGVPESLYSSRAEPSCVEAF